MRLSWSKIAANGSLIEFSVFFSTRLFFSFLVVVGTFAFFFVYLLYLKWSVDEIRHLESTFPVNIAFNLLECMTFLGAHGGVSL